MKFERFEDMIVWQKGQDFTILAYQHFKCLDDSCFKNQLLRACISITNNIAEGFERRTNKDFKHFLFISKGSSGEVRSMLYLAERLNYINKEEYQKLKELSIEISKMLSGLIKTLN
jgi:four helix bundle protein